MPVSSIPFEERYLPPDPRRRKRERLSRTDRFVCGFMGGLLGFALWVMASMIWFSMIMKATARRPLAGPPCDPDDLLLPFWSSSFPVATLVIFGAIFGPERLMDAFAMGSRILAKFAEAVNRQHPN